MENASPAGRVAHAGHDSVVLERFERSGARRERAEGRCWPGCCTGRRLDHLDPSRTCAGQVRRTSWPVRAAPRPGLSPRRGANGWPSPAVVPGCIRSRSRGRRTRSSRHWLRGRTSDLSRSPRVVAASCAATRSARNAASSGPAPDSRSGRTCGTPPPALRAHRAGPPSFPPGGAVLMLVPADRLPVRIEFGPVVVRADIRHVTVRLVRRRGEQQSHRGPVRADVAPDEQIGQGGHHLPTGDQRISHAGLRGRVIGYPPMEFEVQGDHHRASPLRHGARLPTGFPGQ